MTKHLQIEHEDGADGGRYWAAVNGGEAELTYKTRGDKIIVIDHTYVPPPARGGSIAQQLVERAASDARMRGVKIVPQCPYVDKLFSRRPDLNALRAA
jgi:hypothetical protein